MGGPAVGRHQHGFEEREDVVGVSLTDTAISKIKEMILDGRLTPGSELPREATLPRISASAGTPFGKRSAAVADPDSRRASGHRAIATAIRDRQAAVARAWATAHIAGVETGCATQWPIRTRRRVWRRSRRPKA